VLSLANPTDLRTSLGQSLSFIHHDRVRLRHLARLSLECTQRSSIRMTAFIRTALLRIVLITVRKGDGQRPTPGDNGLERATSHVGVVAQSRVKEGACREQGFCSMRPACSNPHRP
jgi:hypothetical protein